MENTGRPEIPYNVDPSGIRSHHDVIYSAIIQQLTTAWEYCNMMKNKIALQPQMRMIERLQADFHAILNYSKWKRQNEEENFTPKYWKWDGEDLIETTADQIPAEDWEEETDPPGNPDPLADGMTLAKWPKEQDPDYYSHN